MNFLQAMMKTPWHNAFVTSMADSNVYVGITSTSNLGKHFTWIDESPLIYTQWRDLHPTHHDLVNDDQRVGTILHPYSKAADDSALIPGLRIVTNYFNQ